MSAEVMIKQEEWLRIRLKNAPGGLLMKVKAHPAVEEYFRGLSGDRADAVERTGNNIWYDPNQVELKVYRVGTAGSASGYDFRYAGFSLTGQDAGLNPNQVNLSFLRLKGIGTEEGVVLGIKFPASLEERRDWLNDVEKAFSNFVRDHLNQITLELVISNREF